MNRGVSGGAVERAGTLALAWLGGVAWQVQQGDLLAAGANAALGAAGLWLAGWGWAWHWGWCPRPDRPHARRWAGLLLLAAAAARLAFASTTQRAAWRLAGALALALEGQDLQVTGRIAALPRLGPTGTHFVLDTDSATLHGQPVPVPARLALGWYRAPDEDGPLAGPPEPLRAGQRWLLPLRLRQPHGTLNPGGFDLELWAFEQGIGASGSVRSQPAPRKLDEDTGHPVQRLRQQLREAIAQRVADPTAAGVLAALAVGDQAAIDRPGWDVFRATGVAHLMSISGLHVTMFAWLAGAVIGRLWRLQPRLLLAWPAPQAARVGGLLAAAGYALLAGWGVPAQRTVWMIGIVVLLRCAGLRWPLHAVLLAAAWAVAMIDPWALLQPGFWLSFGAVALLVAAEPVTSAGPPGPLRSGTAQGWRARVWGAVRSGLRTQAVATVGLAPLTLVFFQQLSIVGFVANLVAIPLVTLLITPLALLGVLLPPLWTVAAWAVQGLMAGLQVLAAWPWAVWQAAAAPPWAVAAGLLGGALAVLPLPWRLRWLALPLVLPLCWPPVARPAAGQFELVAADVGQGTAVLVRTRHHLLVFDTGPAYTPEADASSRVLLPLLRWRGERQVDLLVLSHRDADHVGGAATLLAGLPVRALATSLEPGHPLRAGAAPHWRCDAGQAWDWDGVHFELLHPLPADHGLGLKSNAISCVLKVQAGGPGAAASALLTGDIEAAQEAALVQRSAAPATPASALLAWPVPGPAGAAAPRVRSGLSSQVLLVPHHGSRTSSSAAFIDAVQPQVAVVQAAYRSRYGHPAPDVLARYAARGIEVVRSDRCGAWTWRSGASAVASPADPPAVAAAAAGLNADPPAGLHAASSSATCQRDVARRYWHHRQPVVTGASR